MPDQRTEPPADGSAFRGKQPSEIDCFQEALGFLQQEHFLPAFQATATSQTIDKRPDSSEFDRLLERPARAGEVTMFRP